MKTDESTINDNAVRLIQETLADIYSYLELEAEKTRIATLAEISGILRMADAMKEVLRE